ncbi:glutamate synthase-related protein [Thermodesulfobacteriota bacterium]
MPSKYIIHTRPVSNRFEPITKSGIIAWEEGCLKCAVCVKKQCVYGVYDNRGLNPRQMIESIDNQCKNCFRCVQNCPKELIHKSVNPEFKVIGDSHWTPDIIARLWYQAETGKIPVSGAGYPGPFSGPGFDSMWTDMSEIVRPTRDGIHGREYISTAMDLGRTPRHLVFSETGELENDPPGLIDIPLPIIMRVPSFGSISEKTIKGWCMAARKLGTFLALPHEKMGGDLESFKPDLIPIISSGSKKGNPGDEIRMVELIWDEDWDRRINELKKLYPSSMISARLPLENGVEEKIFPLVDAGCPVIHLEGSMNGRTMDDESLFVKDGIRSVNLALVEAGIRDEITLIASGGIAMAEHVAKAIICGADAVYLDFPALIALECRMCHRCEQGLSCPVEIEEAPSKWVAYRTLNLFGALHNQLLEVMGAMGIRDVRRLRGEVGRAMFFEAMDKEMFGSLVEIEEGCELE